MSACHSEAAGQAFVDAGVPHVVAVKLHDKISDRASHTFTELFYSQLVNGHTVQEAFDLARQAVEVDPKIFDRAEAKKFRLLPEDGDHNISIFDDISEGMYVNESPDYTGRRKPFHECLLGRHDKAYEVLSLSLFILFL